MTSPRVLVTGAAGMVGSNLVPALLARGWEVSGIDDLSMGSMDNLAACEQDARFSMTIGDVRDEGAYRAAAEGASAVVHLAAKKIPKFGHAMDTLVVNSECAEMVLGEAARTGARVLLASTSDVYGMSQEQPVTEESLCVLGPSNVKRWSYAVSKLFDEHLAHAFAAEYGLDATIMRFFNSYGPHHHRSWWGGPQSVFIDQALTGGTLCVHGDGMQQRCFTYADDLIEGIALCLESDRLAGEVINLGNPDGEVTIAELARLVCELTGRDVDEAVVFEPHAELFGKYQEVVRRVPDITKARETLGYAPSVTLRDGLERTIAWHLENPLPAKAS